MDVTLPPEFGNWAPVRVFWQGTRPYLDWCYMGDERFVQPFFDNTIQSRLRDPFNLLFIHRTPVEDLKEINSTLPSLSPRGFIFHMSRCGSTLVTQMLASLPQNIVISEATSIDSILKTNLIDPTVDDEQRIEWLRDIVAALGRKRSGEEANYFIKFDSWNTFELGLIRRAFPDVPWVFLYRDPLEVLVSQMRQSGAQMIPGTLAHLLPGLDMLTSVQMPREEYCALVLQGMCQAAIREVERDESRALLLNYAQLPQAVTTLLPGHFSVSFAPDQIAQMEDAAKFNAKSPGDRFVTDSKAKRDEASVEMRTAAMRVAPSFEKLESIREKMGIGI